MRAGQPELGGALRIGEPRQRFGPCELQAVRDAGLELGRALVQVSGYFLGEILILWSS